MGQVGTARKIDNDVVLSAFTGVVGGEKGTEAVSLGADDVVGARIEVRAALKDLDADGVLLQLGGIAAGEVMVRDIPEKLAQLGRTAKGGRGQNAFQLLTDVAR